MIQTTKPINRGLAVAGVALALIACGKTAAQASTAHPCGLSPYPRLRATIVDYGQLHNWRSECGQHPRIVHRLLTTGCNQYECNYPSGLAYRRWVRHFTRTHGGIPTDDLLLGS